MLSAELINNCKPTAFQDLKRKIEEVDLDFILQSPEKSPVEFPPVKNVKDTLSEVSIRLHCYYWHFKLGVILLSTMLYHAYAMHHACICLMISVCVLLYFITLCCTFTIYIGVA